MSTAALTTAPAQRELKLVGDTVLVIGAGAGIGRETARRVRAEGADVIITGRDAEQLERVALELDVRRATAFDADDPAALKRFFDGLPDPIDHVVVTAGGRALALDVARNAVRKMRPGGTLLLMGDTGPSFTTALAVALAPVRVRVNLINPALVDTHLSASLRDDPLDARRAELLDTLAVGGVVGTDDVAALAVDVMANITGTGATFDIDGDQQVLLQGV